MALNTEQQFSLQRLLTAVFLVCCGLGTFRLFGPRGFLLYYDVVLVITVLFRQPPPIPGFRNRFTDWVTVGLLTAMLHAFTLLPVAVTTR